MIPAQIVELRGRAGWTQGQLAQLVGVHAITVSKWERSRLVPTLWQSALMEAFAFALDLDPEVGRRAVAALPSKGSPAAVYEILRVRFAEVVPVAAC